VPVGPPDATRSTLDVLDVQIAPYAPEGTVSSTVHATVPFAMDPAVPPSFARVRMFAPLRVVRDVTPTLSALAMNRAELPKKLGSQ
jgi:hypothetical protein